MKPKFTDDDGRFRFVNYRHTNLSTTFARVRREQEAEKRRKLKTQARIEKEKRRV